MDETKYVDRDGFVWDKHCSTCDHLQLYSERKDNTTTCRAFGISILVEPVKSYNDVAHKGNTCPHYRGS